MGWAFFQIVWIWLKKSCGFVFHLFDLSAMTTVFLPCCNCAHYPTAIHEFFFLIAMTVATIHSMQSICLDMQYLTTVFTLVFLCAAICCLLSGFRWQSVSSNLAACQWGWLIPEIRRWLPLCWLNSHIHKRFTNFVTSRALVVERRRRKRVTDLTVGILCWTDGKVHKRTI